MASIQLEVTQDDRAAIKACLDGVADVNEVAEIIARMGAREALDQVTGKSVPGTMSELRLFRVRALLLEGVDFHVAESIAAILLKVPLASAKRIVESAVARFDVELNSAVENAAKAALEKAEWEAPFWKVDLPSTAVRKWLQNEAVAAGQPTIRQGGRGSVWEFPDGTYQRVCRRVGLAKRSRP
jgi:hypothetical protein